MAVTPQDNEDYGDPADTGAADEVVEGAAPEDETTGNPETDDAEVEDEGSTEDRPNVNIEELGDHNVVVRVDGRDVTMTLKEALAGSMRQADYTRKTQELSAERDRLASFSRLAEALEEDPAGTIAVLQRALGVDGAAAVLQEAEELDPNEARFRRIEAFAETQEQEARNRQHISAAKAAITATAGLDADEGELLQFAIDNHVLDLPTAARFLQMEKAATVKTATKAEQIAAATKAKRAANVVESGSRRAGDTTVLAVAKKMTLRQAYDAAKLSNVQS